MSRAGQATRCGHPATRLPGSAITDYVIQFSSLSGTTWAAWQTWQRPASTAVSATLTGLVNGTAYAFRVAAVNAAGTGSYTTSWTTAIPVAMPTITQATAGNGQVTLTWTAPSATAAPITQYAVQYAVAPAPGQAALWQEAARVSSTTLTSTVTGLVNGTGYLFRVSALTPGYGPTQPTTMPVVPRSLIP
jgi:hypothetical protein